MRKVSAPRRRLGFTLVELLVVIAIIAVLAALISPALFNVIGSTHQTRIKMEVDQLASAIESYKAKYGSYPPAALVLNLNGSNMPADVPSAALVAHIARVFPRYAIVTQPTLAAQIRADLMGSSSYQPRLTLTSFNPQNALVFWLKGFPSNDPTDPFNRGGYTPGGTNPLVQGSPIFDFDRTRLIDTSTGVAATDTSFLGNLIYNAPYGGAAYAYFDSQSYGQQSGGALFPGSVSSAQPFSNLNSYERPWYVPNSSPTAPSGSGVTESTQPATSTSVLPSGSGVIVPYILDANNNSVIDVGENFAKPTAFQIISAGSDGNFGTWGNASVYGKMYPTGLGYDSTGAEDDNITNFCEKNNLADAKP